MGVGECVGLACGVLDGVVDGGGDGGWSISPGQFQCVLRSSRVKTLESGAGAFIDAAGLRGRVCGCVDGTATAKAAAAGCG